MDSTTPKENNMTIGQSVRVVAGVFAGSEGTIESYREKPQTFVVRCGEDDKEPTGDFQLHAIRIEVPCESVRFV